MPSRLANHLHYNGEEVEGRAGQVHGGRLAAYDLGDVSQHLAQADVRAAEDITLADLAPSHRQKMPRRHVVHVHEVQTRIDEGGDFACGRLDDDAASGRRLDVARADGRGGIDDHSGQSLVPHHVLDQSLGNHLAALIGADGVLRR